MAELAATLEQPTQTFDWDYAESQFTQYQFVDDIPALALGRQAIKDEAWALLNRRRELKKSDSKVELPLDVDALSRAHMVLAAKKQFGEDSQEYQEQFNGLLLDYERYVGEWYRKKKPEHFEPVHHRYEAATGDYYAHGVAIGRMTENALTPIEDEPEEEGRRVNERVEEATPHLLFKHLGAVALKPIRVRTVSECPDSVIAQYEHDQRQGKHRGYRGYVPEIRKNMFRDFVIDPKTGDRWEEQLATPGTYHTPEIIRGALAIRQLRRAHGLSKNELLGAQFLVDDDIFDFVALLDTVASREWCTEVFIGEEVTPGTKKDYAGFREQARRRRKELQDVALVTAQYVLDLAAEDFDLRKAPQKVENFVKMQLLEIGKHDVIIAEQMFDIRTAFGLQEVAFLEMMGAYDQAEAKQNEVLRAAPGGGACGPSCGIEQLSILSTRGQEIAKKLGAQPGDVISRDTSGERRCNCGSKKVIYAHNSRGYTRGCESCGRKETKINVVSAQKAA